MSSSSSSASAWENVEVKRRQNLEDNRRFLAQLKINDIRNEIKVITNQQETIDSRRRPAMKKENSTDPVRRSSRVRKNVLYSENKTDENRTRTLSKVKLELPEHMLIRYHSTSKKVPLHNPKSTWDN